MRFSLPGPRKLLLGLKILFGALLLFLLARMVDWREFWFSLKEVSLAIFVLVICLNLVSVVVMSFRWRGLILAAGHQVALGPVFLYNMLGLFFSQILPGSISGDAVRIWWLGNRHAGWKKSAGIVFWDRILGLAALVLIALIFLPVYYRQVMGSGAALLSWTLLLSVWLLFLAAQSRRLLALMERLVAKAAGLWPVGIPSENVENFFSGLGTFMTQRRAMVVAFFWSVVLRGLLILGVWILSDSMGLGVPLTYFLFCVPLIELIRSIPVSIQGLGVRELAFVFFLAPLGVSAANATLLSMLFYTSIALCGLMGGLIYLGRNLMGISYPGEVEDVP
jgi:uncharacterized protein (TIRG00374 family)